MLFLKPKPKEKFKYLPAFNSSRFFGEKKRKNQLEFKASVKIMKPSKLIYKPLDETIKTDDKSLESEIEIKNPRSFPSLLKPGYLDLFFDKVSNLKINLKTRYESWFFGFCKKFTVISTLKAFVIGFGIIVFTLVGLLAFVDTNFIVTNWQFELVQILI